MSVVIDTSVWVDHFKRGNRALVRLIENDDALTHGMVLAELACGTPPAPRLRTLQDISMLQPCKQATLDEVIAFVEREQLYGLGCGLVDMVVLVSTLITPGARLYTLDKRLAKLASRFDVAFQARLH